MKLTAASKSPGLTVLPVARSPLTMPGKAAKITITERQQEILQTFSRAVTAPSRLRQRASIIVVASISPSQVGRYLREAALQPHKSRYWLNTTEKDPRRFEEQVKAVCDTYLAAPQRERAEHTHTVSVDEMTGLQALERIAPSKA